MFFSIDSKTFIRIDHIAAVTFGTSYAQVYVAGQPAPFRVAGHDKIAFLRELVQPKIAAVPVDADVTAVTTIAPEVQTQNDVVTEKKGKRK